MNTVLLCIGLKSLWTQCPPCLPRLVIKAQNGDGTAQKSKEAPIWFNLAAANGNEEAKSNRDKVAGMEDKGNKPHFLKNGQVW